MQCRQMCDNDARCNFFTWYHAVPTFNSNPTPTPNGWPFGQGFCETSAACPPPGPDHDFGYVDDREYPHPRTPDFVWASWKAGETAFYCVD